jgi:hypothetical protein
VRTGQVAGRAHERVIVEDVKDAGYRLDDIVFAQFCVAATTFAAGALAAPSPIPEPATAPTLAAVAVVVLLVVLLVVRAATALLAARALLITVRVARI